MIVSLAATRERKTSPAQHSVLRHHVGVRACEHRRGRDSPRRPAGERKVLLVADGTRMASKRCQRRDMRVLRTHGWTASKVMPGFFHQRVDATETISWLKGSDALLNRLDRANER